jgi:hypothetical protein
VRTIREFYTVGLFVSVLLLCSCATTSRPSSDTSAAPLPADVSMNKDAGRGAHLYIMLRLQTGAELPFLVDTGSPVTVFAQSLAPQLGKRLDTTTLSNFGDHYQGGFYAAPKLYLGRTPLITAGHVLASDYVEQMSARTGRPLLGVLGMDCLQHYCLQLDFQAGKVRFLDPNRLHTTHLGQAFTLTFSSAGNSDSDYIRPFTRRCSLAGGPDCDLCIDTGANGDGALEPQLFRRELEARRSRAGSDAPQDQEPNSVELPQCVWSGGTYTDLHLGKGRDSKEGDRGESSLGLAFLARHLVTFDFPHRIMYLRQTRRGPLVDEELVAAGRAAGDSALPFARELWKNGQLPGCSRRDGSTLADTYRFEPNPDTVTFDLRKEGDSAIYHYSLTRASKNGPWQLQKAWRTDADGRLMEEYPIP